MRLKEINTRDQQFIKLLTNTPQVYRYIRNGKPWDDDKVSRFINKCLGDQEMSPEDRHNFNYLIKGDGLEDIGIIGVSYKHKKYSLTVFTLPEFHGQGYFSKSLNLLIRRLRRYKPNLLYMFAQTHVKNKKMNSILSRKFLFVKKFKIGDIWVNEFKIYL